MMKRVMSLRKGLPALLAIAVVGLAGCLPKPEEPIEWLEREDAVIVQMKTVESAESELAQRLAVPDFTLYGDGTLIYSTDGAGQTQLLQAKLPEDAVRDLLEFIVDKDFLVFGYQQPTPERETERPTTYLYVHTKLEANAVGAYALDSVLPEDAGKEWEQFSRLQEITERLDSIAGGTEGPSGFVPKEVLLVVQPTDPPEVVGSVAEWPIAGIDLAAIAPAGSGLVERRIDGSEAGQAYDGIILGATQASVVGPFRQEDRYFFVGLRPILPFEEHFPEFEGP